MKKFTREQLVIALIGILLIGGVAIYNLHLLPFQIITPSIQYYSEGQTISIPYQVSKSELANNNNDIFSTYGWAIIPLTKYNQNKQLIDHDIYVMNFQKQDFVPQASYNYLYNDIWGAHEIPVTLTSSYFTYGINKIFPDKAEQSNHGVVQYDDRCSIGGQECHKQIILHAPHITTQQTWQEFVVLVAQCTKQHSEWWNPFWNFKCEAQKFNIIVTKPDFCGDIPGYPSGKSLDGWHNYCFTHYKGYCDDSPLAHKCVTLCKGGCSGDSFCIADYIEDGAKLAKLKAELSTIGTGTLGCVRKSTMCANSLDCGTSPGGISLQELSPQYGDITMPIIATGGYYCDLENQPAWIQKINSYLTTYPANPNRIFGTCSPGCYRRKDCTDTLGLARDRVQPTQYGGDKIDAQGWNCINSNCYVAWCSNDPDCFGVMRNTLAECDITRGICVRPTCQNDYDCWNREIAPNKDYAPGCVNGFCEWKYKGYNIPKGRYSATLCEIASNNGGIPEKLPGPNWRFEVKDINGQIRCIPTQFKPPSECNPTHSNSQIVQECIAKRGQPRLGYTWGCINNYAPDPQLGTCTELRQEPTRDCRVQSNPDLYCMRTKLTDFSTCQTAYCDIATGDCLLKNSKTGCTTDQECYYSQDITGKCIKTVMGSCCDYSGIPSGCTTNANCNDNQFCSNNQCVDLDCQLGFIPKNHKCVEKGKAGGIPFFWIIAFFGIGTLIGWVANANKREDERKKYTLLFGLILAVIPLVFYFLKINILPDVITPLITYLTNAVPKCNWLNPATWFFCKFPYWSWVLGGLILGVIIGAFAGFGIATLPGAIIGGVVGAISGFILYGLLNVLQLPIVIIGTILAVFYSHAFLTDIVKDKNLRIIVAIVFGGIAGYVLYTAFWWGIIVLMIYFFLKIGLARKIKLLDIIKK